MPHNSWEPGRDQKPGVPRPEHTSEPHCPWTMDSLVQRESLRAGTARWGAGRVGGMESKTWTEEGDRGVRGGGPRGQPLFPTFPSLGCAALRCLAASCAWPSCRASLPLQPWLCCNKTGPLAHLQCLFHFSVRRAEMHSPPPLPQQPVLERISKPCGNGANDFLEGCWPWRAPTPTPAKRQQEVIAQNRGGQRRGA